MGECEKVKELELGEECVFNSIFSPVLWWARLAPRYSLRLCSALFIEEVKTELGYGTATVLMCIIRIDLY